MGYGKTSPEAIKNDEQRLSGGKWFKVPQGGCMVYLCPPWHEQGTRPYHEIKVHYNISDGPVLCLKTLNQPCPACEANADLYNRKDDKAAQDLSRDIYAKTMFFYNVLAPVQPQADQAQGINWLMPGKPLNEMEIKPYFVGIKLHKQFGQFYNFHGDIYDPENCNPIQLIKDQSGKDPKFASTFANVYPNKCRLHNDLLKLLDKMPDLSKEIPETSYDEIKRLVDLKLANWRAATGGSMMPNTTVSVPVDPVPNTVVIAPNPAQPDVQPIQPPGVVAPSSTVAETPPPAAVITMQQPEATGVPTELTPPPVSPPQVQAQAQEAVNPIDQLNAFEAQLRNQ